MTFIASLRVGFARTTGFLTLPVTTLLVIVYIAVAISTLITDQISPVPSSSTLRSQYGGLNVTEAYKDLHVVAARPHAYHSHANDVVRDYLIRRLKNIRIHSGDLIIDDDLISNGTWATTSSTGTYFEGNNILVKVRGTANATSSHLPAVLFSAHFDSVSTASGAIDDGMGVVILLQLIQYFAANPPLRTVLFNINNGEEDGLNGAHALLEHPWIKNTSDPEFINMYGSTFINLEGAASGGRPLLFRATDIGALKSWKGVETPHANIISLEAFNFGLIRSGTDYSVYTSASAVPDPLDSKYAPMRGLDFSFYRGRSKYHTKFDSVSYTEGGDRAIWAMMLPAWTAGVALANDDNVSPSEERAVYFELFNSALILFPLTYLLTFNITSLVVGPIVLILLAISESALVRSRAAKRQQATFSPSVVRAPGSSASHMLSLDAALNETEQDDNQAEESDSGRGWHKRKRVSAVLWKHGRFWIALILTIGAQVGLVVGFVNYNAFIAYGNLTAPVISSFTLAILVPSIILSPPHISTKSKISPQTPTTTNVPAWTSFRTLLTHSYVFVWLLLLASTVGITQFGMGGMLYFISIWSGLLWLASTICGICGCFGIAETTELELIQVSDEVQPTEDDETETNEHTPLIGRKRLRLINKSKAGIDPKENPQPYVLWIFILLILVPVPLIVNSHIAIFLFPSLNQTLADGSPAVTIYAAISLLSLLSTLPIFPFIGARRVHRYLLWALTLLWVLTTALAWIPWSGAWAGSVHGFQGGLFPFSEDTPYKVFFQQTVDLSSSNTTTNAKVVTTLAGAAPFLQDMILPLIPSYLDSVAHGREVKCIDMQVGQKKLGLVKCTWETYNAEADVAFAKMDMIPVASGSPDIIWSAEKNRTSWDWTSTTNPWLQAYAKSLSFNGTEDVGARFFITGNNSRACRVYVDHPVDKFRVRTVSTMADLIEDYKDSSDAEWKAQRGFEFDSLNTLHLWSREWGKSFVVDVQWSSSPASLSSAIGTQAMLSPNSIANVVSNHTRSKSGHVACEWVEYESGMVGMGLSTSPLPSPSGRRVTGGKIPAFEEVLTYLPKWATVTKLADGLVEVKEKFVLSGQY